MNARRIVSAALLMLPLAGCGHMPLTSATMVGAAKDWSGVAASYDYVPSRSPFRTVQDNALSATSKFLCNASVENKAPDAFILSTAAKDFRKAEEGQADDQRKALASKIKGDSSVMSAFGSWDKQSDSAKLDVLKHIADLEGQVMDFTPPPVSTKTGVPKDGTMAYFMGGKDGIGKVVLYPKAIATGDKWAAIATVTHEMRHAYQFQLAIKGSKDKLAKGSADEVLAYGFAAADKVIEQVGGEDNLSYGDYCHLTNEWDAFATGNMVAAIVSKGQADTSGLGFVDLQFSATGKPLCSLASLESKVGASKLLDAVNQAEQKADKSSKEEIKSELAMLQ